MSNVSHEIQGSEIPGFAWLPTQRTCSCPDGYLNCLPKDAWLVNAAPIWEIARAHDHNDRAGDSPGKRNIAPEVVPIGSKHPDHPATFPFALAEQVIHNYSHPGETVLDPFCGSGTVLVAARVTGRHAIGCDLNPMYIEHAKSALGSLAACHIGLEDGHHCALCLDARRIGEVLPANSIDLVFTSPPYWDMLKQRPARRNKKRGKYLKTNYSTDPHDLSNALSLPEYLGALRAVARELRRVLKPGGRCIINIGDYRRRGQYIPLHAKCIDLMEGLGFVLQNIIFWDRRREYNVGVFGYPYRFMASNGMVEYLLEFRAPGKNK